MTAASWRPAPAPCAADNKQAQPLNMTCRAFVGEPAAHGGTHKVILIIQMSSQHCDEDMARNTITGFKPSSVHF